MKKEFKFFVAPTFLGFLIFVKFLSMALLSFFVYDNIVNYSSDRVVMIILVGIALIALNASWLVIGTAIHAYKKVVINEEAIFVKGLRGKVARIEINEINNVSIHKGPRGFEYIRVTGIKEDWERKKSFRKMNGFMFQYSKKRVQILSQFWRGAIMDLRGVDSQ